jgi:hypothetical protein
MAAIVLLVLFVVAVAVAVVIVQNRRRTGRVIAAREPRPGPTEPDR